MTTRWKELPASETNDFRPGDRIRIYDHSFIVEAEIDYAVNDLVAVKIKSMPLTEYRYSFRQCRKLVEERPREWHVITNGTAVVTIAADDKNPPPKGCEKIRVREVIEPEDPR